MRQETPPKVKDRHVALAHEKIEVPGLPDDIIGVHCVSAADEKLEASRRREPYDLVERGHPRRDATISRERPPSVALGVSARRGAR